jgi:putative peptidoglycan lipid II flippase
MAIVGDGPPAGAARPTARSGIFIGSVNLLARTLDRVAALVQITVVAAVFGATSRADLFFLASIAPLALGTIVSEPLGRSFLGLLVGSRSRSEGVSVAAAGMLVSLLVVSALTLAYLGVAFAVVEIFSPAGTESFGPWLAFGAIAPSVGLAGYAGAVLLWLEEYSWAAARTPLASVSALALLVIAVGLTDRVIWVAVAVGAGYVAGLGVLLARITRLLGPGWILRSTRPAFFEALRVRRHLAAPVAGAVLGGQVIVLLERALAATLGVGAVAIVSYARGIASAPAVISQAVGAGAYPGMVRAASVGSRGYLSASFLIGLRVNLYIGTAFAAYVGLFGTSLTAFLLQRGAFQQPASARAGDVLTAFAASTLTGGLLFYLVAVLYGIASYSGLLFRSLAIFVSYLALAPLLLIALDEVGLALAFSLAQAAGVAASAALVGRRLAVPMGNLVRAVVVPVLPRVGLVIAVLGGYRLIVGLVEVPIVWRGVVNVLGSGLTLLAVLAVGLLSSPLPEGVRLREVIVARLARAGALLPSRRSS